MELNKFQKESFESLNHITVALVLSHLLDSFRNMHRSVGQLPLKVSRSSLTRSHSSSLFPDFCSSVSYIFWKINRRFEKRSLVQKYSWALRPRLWSMSRDITFCTLTVNHDSVFWSVLFDCRRCIMQKLTIYILLKVTIFIRLYLVTYRESKKPVLVKAVGS